MGGGEEGECRRRKPSGTSRNAGFPPARTAHGPQVLSNLLMSAVWRLAAASPASRRLGPPAALQRQHPRLKWEAAAAAAALIELIGRMLGC